MRNTIIALTMAAIATIGATGTASAWERKVTIDTQRGTISETAEVYCFGGACYREAEITGVNGNTLRRSGMCVPVGYRQWDCQGTVTRPSGASRTRHVQVSVN